MKTLHQSGKLEPLLNVIEFGSEGFPNLILRVKSRGENIVETINLFVLHALWNQKQLKWSEDLIIKIHISKPVSEELNNYNTRLEEEIKQRRVFHLMPTFSD